VKIVRAAARLVRLDTSFAGFLSIWLPFMSRTRDVTVSSIAALPLFFISVCTFIANDLSDIERDRINHPERPLAKGEIRAEVAAGLYFVFLFLALMTIRFCIPSDGAFLYYVLLILSASYVHIVERAPGVKAPYVATAIALPVVIIASRYPAEKNLYVVASAVLLFSLGKELCMDLLDRPGDTYSFMHQIAAWRVASTAFALQIIAMALLLLQSRRFLDVIVCALLTVSLARSYLYWFREGQPKKALLIMRAQLFVGLYFAC